MVYCLEIFLFLDLASRRCSWDYSAVGFDFVFFIFIVYKLILDLNKYMYYIVSQFWLKCLNICSGVVATPVCGFMRIRGMKT